MTTVNQIYNEINKLAPFSLALGFDNCGLLVGSKEKQITACILALDVTNEVIDLAIKHKANLIITHHPIIFDPIKSVTDDSRVYKLIKNDISVISAHTNLDIVDGGVNDVLVNLIGLTNVSIFENSDGVGRIGELKQEMTGKQLAQLVKQNINAKGVIATHTENTIKKVAVIGGAGGDYLESAITAGADAFITGEAQHHVVIDAINSDITLICTGHYYTEAPVLYSLKTRLEEKVSDVEFIIYDEFLVEEI